MNVSEELDTLEAEYLEELGEEAGDSESDGLEAFAELRTKYEEKIAALESASRKRLEQARREHDDDLRVLREEQEESERELRERIEALGRELEEERKAHQLTRERLESKEAELEQQRSVAERWREELEDLRSQRDRAVCEAETRIREEFDSQQFFRAAAFAKAFDEIRQPEAEAAAEARLEELIREFVREYST